MKARKARKKVVFFSFFLWCLPGVPSASAQVTDCNGNGVDDLQDVAASTSQDCNSNGIPDVCEIGAFQLAPRPALATGGSPAAVATADFDGDGLLDVAALGDGDGGVSISVLFQEEGRTFERVDFAVGSSGRAVAIAAGDVDGDGDSDLVTLDFVLLGVFLNDGSGVFAAAARVDTAVGASGLALGDVDGDGRADVVHTDRTRDEAVVRRSDGRGGLREPIALGAGDSPRGPLVADLDADGIPDIALVNRRSGEVSLSWGAGDGSVTIGEPVTVVESSPDRLLAEDLDGDGLLDLLVGTPSAILSRRNLGGRNFDVPVTFTLEAPVGSLAALATLDADSDGDFDVVAPRRNPNGFAILRNQDGFLVASLDFERRAPPSKLAGRDLDGDGHHDLIEPLVVERGVQIYWSREEASIVMETRTFAVPTQPHAMTIGDVDGDVDLDVGVGTNQALSILFNDGRGDFEEVTVTVGDRRITLDSMTFADLDVDGDLDVVSVGVETDVAQLFFNDGDRSFRVNLQHRLGNRPFSVSAGDLDGDGLPEVISANEGSNNIGVLRNLGDEQFTEETLDVGSGPRAAELADVDLDGDLDLVAALTRASQVAILTNGGRGDFREAATLDVPSPFDLIVADFDADGDPDFVTAAAASQTENLVAFLENRGDRTFATPVAVDRGLPYYSLLAHDVDSDGLLDLLGANISGAILVYRNDGAGGFLRPLSFPVGGGSRFVVAGDLDADVDVDLVALGRDDWNVTALYNVTESSGVPYRSTICTEAEFFELSAARNGSGAAERFTRYILPTEPGAVVGPLFPNVGRYARSREFLMTEFQVQFPKLSAESFTQVFVRRGTRQYVTGDVLRLRDETGVAYGFSVLGEISEPPPTVEEVGAVLAKLGDVFALRPLVYTPDTETARKAAGAWEDPPFGVFLETTPEERPDSGATPTFSLDIPPGTEVCGGYVGRGDAGIGVTAREWVRLQTTVLFLEGEIGLPTANDSFEGELFEEVRLGPDRRLASPEGSGTFSVQPFSRGDTTNYRFRYEQTYRLDDTFYVLRLFNLDFAGRGEVALDGARRLDAEFLTHRLAMEGFLDQAVSYSTCGLELLPRWEISVELADGSLLELVERFAPPVPGETGPAALVFADLSLRGERRRVESYWDLIYAAERHNQAIRYWVLLEPPLVLDQLARPVRVVEVVHPQAEPVAIAAAVNYLDEDWAVLASPVVSTFSRALSLPSSAVFRRGDVDADARRTVSDALTLLRYLFTGGNTLPCPKAADANDDGKLNILDPIRIVRQLFGGREPLPAPASECGADATEDGLTCESFEACMGQGEAIQLEEK